MMNAGLTIGMVEAGLVTIAALAAGVVLGWFLRGARANDADEPARKASPEAIEESVRELEAARRSLADAEAESEAIETEFKRLDRALAKAGDRLAHLQKTLGVDD